MPKATKKVIKEETPIEDELEQTDLDELDELEKELELEEDELDEQEDEELEDPEPVKPAKKVAKTTKAAKTTKSLSFILPSSQASVKAIITEAAVVLPYFIILLNTLSSDNLNFFCINCAIRKLA